MEVVRMATDRKENKFRLGLSFSKYLLLLLNVVFAVSGVLMILSGISTMVIFNPFSYSELADNFQMLAVFWIIVGTVFMSVAFFGIFVAFKESTVLANLYGLSMMFVFLSQISAGIAGFSMISKSGYMVSDQLDQMIRYYNHDYYLYREKIDWIQSKFECCGINGPSDWQQYESYWTPFGSPDIYDYPNRTADSPTKNLMPSSCCVQYSNYVNLTCERYHTSGCYDPIYESVHESIMTIGSSSIALAFVQVLGIVFGFLFAQMIRRGKTERIVNIWNSGQEYSAAPRTSPAYPDHSQITDQGEGSDVKYI